MLNYGMEARMKTRSLVLRGLFIEPQDLEKPVAAFQLEHPLLFLGLTLSRHCNYRCRYCAQEAGHAAPQELSSETLRDLIAQGYQLGAKSVILAGAGEPLLDPAFPSVVETASEFGLTTVLYTNGSAVTARTAKFLYSHDVSVCIKLDTFSETRFNWLAGHANGFRLTLRGLDHLLDAGYADTTRRYDSTNVVRLAANAVVTRGNLPDLISVAEYCGKRNIKIFFDNLSLVGRAAQNWQELMTPPSDYLQVCAEVNTALGYEAVGHSLDRADACILWKHGIVIYLDGEARVCYDDPATPRIGSIYENSLLELTRIKQSLHPPQPSQGDCPLKCCLRQRLRHALSCTLPEQQWDANLRNLFDIEQAEWTRSPHYAQA